jgi:hypothetical protein
MATADQVKALLRRHAEDDDAHFYSVTMQLAGRAARGGQSKSAQELRDLVDSLRAQSGQPKSRPGPVPQPRGGAGAGESARTRSATPGSRPSSSPSQPDPSICRRRAADFRPGRT